MEAVRLEGGASQPPVWQLQGEVRGKEVNPSGVTSDRKGRVYVCDQSYGSHSRILLVNGYTGKVIEDHKPSDLGDVYNVCCLSKSHKLVVYAHHSDNKVLSLYDITSL